ncbi:PadR family transcriptional regulator [Arthrobacter sp. ISL-69]|uniref:PadR family transcriptional regulator n=1 Tax=Arthrobacter sp. ISL-69 TaxID=2819113 RepID=UPI001BEBEC53|nr:helix-turn-helix transcriptional regulator [Arthrobacter sp. ISL-69]
MTALLQPHGFTRIKGGTLYPLLNRLDDQGLVEHTWQHDQAGPGRKHFTLTELGRQELERSGTAWRRMSEALTQIQTPWPRTRISQTPTPRPPPTEGGAFRR